MFVVLCLLHLILNTEFPKSEYRTLFTTRGTGSTTKVRSAIAKQYGKVRTCFKVPKGQRTMAQIQQQNNCNFVLGNDIRACRRCEHQAGVSIPDAPEVSCQCHNLL
jgi:hypothetical protein